MKANIKTNIKPISFILLSILYPFILVDLMLDTVAPWNPIFYPSPFFQNNWISLLILILGFTGLLYLGQSVHNDKKEEKNVFFKLIFSNVISLALLLFMWIFSIFFIILLWGSRFAYFPIVYIISFPGLFTGLHYLYTFKLKKNEFSFNFNILFLFLGVVLPVIIYGLLSAAIL
ncbi:MAG: hypothetical protein Q7I99_07910 [Acholeplasmataceae bacterium]|nr:hypothetical protein [Acholeplasmataceae bacterium]